jgi:hypothetical protein
MTLPLPFPLPFPLQKGKAKGKELKGKGERPIMPKRTESVLVTLWLTMNGRGQSAGKSTGVHP